MLLYLEYWQEASVYLASFSMFSPRERRWKERLVLLFELLFVGMPSSYNQSINQSPLFMANLLSVHNGFSLVRLTCVVTFTCFGLTGHVQFLPRLTCDANQCFLHHNFLGAFDNLCFWPNRRMLNILVFDTFSSNVAFILLVSPQGNKTIIILW